MAKGEFLDPFCISFDNKYFLNIRSKNFKFELISPKIDGNYDDFNRVNSIEDVLKKYKVEFWRNFIRNINADVYREYDYDELDEEIKDLVYTINKLPNTRTFLSCLGHNIDYMYIAIRFSSFDSIIYFTDLIYKKFLDDFYLVTSHQGIPDDYEKLKGVNYVLYSKQKGEKAWKKSNELREKIEFDLKHIFYTVKEIENADLLNVRVQFYDKGGDLLVDDVVMRQVVLYKVIDKTIDGKENSIKKIYITFDENYLIDINHECFCVLFLEHNANEIKGIQYKKFDINNFSNYEMQLWPNVLNSNAPIYKEV